MGQGKVRTLNGGTIISFRIGVDYALAGRVGAASRPEKSLSWSRAWASEHPKVSAYRPTMRLCSFIWSDIALQSVLRLWLLELHA